MTQQPSPMPAPKATEVDDFGLPLRTYVPPEDVPSKGQETTQAKVIQPDKAPETPTEPTKQTPDQTPGNIPETPSTTREAPSINHDNADHPPTINTSAAGVVSPLATPRPPPEQSSKIEVREVEDGPKTPVPLPERKPEASQTPAGSSTTVEATAGAQDSDTVTALPQIAAVNSKRKNTIEGISGPSVEEAEANRHQAEAYKAQFEKGHARNVSTASTVPSISEASHQQLAAPTTSKEDADKDDDGGWQTMPAYAPYDIYDDDDKLIAKEHNPDQDEAYEYGGLGGAGKGYTKVIDDDDAESQTSLDDNTRYLFANPKSTSLTELEDEQRDAVSQLQATKDLLTEGQRIAYVGLTRLAMFDMVKEVEKVEKLRKSKKEIKIAADAMRMWAQTIMIRLYTHMDISPAEQVMIEQLVEHGVQPQDLTPVLMQNARVKNPKQAKEAEEAEDGEAEDAEAKSEKATSAEPETSTARTSTPAPDPADEPVTPAPPPYEAHTGEDPPETKTPSQLPDTANIDIDLRWTIICDLFLVLIADSIYDSRSRYLLERVGGELEISWIDICRFEKRVTEALEMQQQAEKENWNEEEHVETRRKMGLKRRYAMMGIATVGGGLVIGLSAGLMAPMIGAGLAAGFTAIGVSGTGSFLAGIGGAAVITSSAGAAGSYMGGKAAGRRAGSVKTFEYRPLHNNKRVNLIVTVSGWMTNKHDDVRLPFSTVDPAMGDLYSILWEPEMLQSIGDTINILATEAVTSTLQQVLGAVGLAALMSGLQIPILMAKITYLIDNPWAVSQDRAWAAGQILADSLIARNLGTRPVTLVGYSLGARVIFACLLELEKKGAYGLVQNVYMFGSPVVVKVEEYYKVRSVVSGKFINGYNRTDWILGYLFRLTNGGIRRVAGLAAIEEIPGIENLDCTDWVAGHMAYRTAMPRLLRECEWLVESDEFDEIEDPDPDGHRERQREIINEIEEARKEMEKSAATTKKKSGWGIFGRKKTSRESWEVYEDGKGSGHANGSGSTSSTGKDGRNHLDVLFDSEVTRQEMALAKHDPAADYDGGDLPIRELKSTLPPMKLDADATSPRPSNLRETKSSDATATLGYSTGGANWGSPERGRQEPDEIQMSFDTDYRVPDKTSNTSSQPWADRSTVPDTPEKRPEYKTTKTAPPSMQVADPWADDDDPDFGKEKEIQMTFA
ncbi:hypothetical protein Micbo1qcDRAFT_235548 [Microdochium bolleyi]|uniref:DUF726 domain protein n=1 Tax=Microdochium bolleyi TaxID=196109 RepID=A0A136IWG3_9PEZI|nr:hypothetical protein Micbo1qcDRAFT_235548 [Microdochium bolleyi]